MFVAGRLCSIALASACALAGCVSSPDLSAVAKYAEATADAGSSFAAIASDFAASCARRHDAYLLLPANLGSRALRHTQISLAPGYLSPGATPEAEPTPVPAPDGYADDARCANARAISAEWAAHDETVLAYVRELGAIADVDAVPSIAPSPLGAPLVSANVISQAQFDAFSQLATDIGGFVIAGEQRALVAKLARTTDEPLHDAIGALKLVDAAYAQELGFEYGQTEGGYEALLDRELRARAQAPAAEQFLLDAEIARRRETERETLQAIDDRRAASIAYAAVLDGIAHTHRELYDASTRDAKMGDYVRVFRTTVVPLFQDVQALKAAVK